MLIQMVVGELEIYKSLLIIVIRRIDYQLHIIADIVNSTILNLLHQFLVVKVIKINKIINNNNYEE